MPDDPFSRFAGDLGFGGDLLRRQQQDDTEEMRRKKKLGFQMPVPGELSQLGPGTISMMGKLTGKGY